MAKLNSRGHEVVSSVPFEPSVRLGRPPRETLDQQIRRMVMLQQMEKEDVIKDEADLMEDLNDFSDPSISDDLLGPSQYEVPEDVPDTFSAESFRAQQKEKKDSPKPADSSSESVALAGE
jgi:hypothetical protein